MSIDVSATRAQEIELLRHREIVERMAAATLVLAGRPMTASTASCTLSIRSASASVVSVGRTFGEVFPDLAADSA